MGLKTRNPRPGAGRRCGSGASEHIQAGWLDASEDTLSLTEVHSRVTRRIARRYGLTAPHARTIAHLSGLGGAR